MVGASSAASVGLSGPGSIAPIAGGARRRLLRDASVYVEGSEADLVWFLHDGLVKLETTGADGARSLVAFRGPGEWLGEHAAVDGRPRMTTAVVVRDASMTSVRRDDFIASVVAAPDVAMALLSSFVGHLRDSVEQELQLASGDPAVLVARRVLSLATEPRFAAMRSASDGALSIEMPISHEELATWAGVSRRSVETALQSLRSAGVISTSRMRVAVLDVDGLEAFSQRRSGGVASGE